MDKILINQNEGIKTIDQIQFGVLSTKDIMKLSSLQVVNSQLYNENKTEAIPFGPLDTRLGVSEKGKVCLTCSKKIQDCPGHFGFVRLDLPLFHSGFYKYTIQVLQCICQECSRLLLPTAVRLSYLKKLSRRVTNSAQREKIYKSIIEECKKVKKCEYCDAFVRLIKKKPDNPLTLITYIDKKKLDNEMRLSMKANYESAIHFYKEIDSLVENSYEELTPLKVYNIFQRIPDEDAVFFDMNHNNSRPVDILVHTVLVPPVSIRPTVQVGYNVTNEDDLTIKIKDIVELNKKIRNSIQEGYNTAKLIEDWYLLQCTHTQYINSEASGLPRNILGNKAIRALSQRLKGKHGRFRGNLSGKRVDFTGRTVISPDPNLMIDQVGVPELMAKNLTFPQKVNVYNINYLRKLILNGPENHPGANYVEQLNGNKISLQYTNRKKIAEDLKIGDIVERHVNDNDIILFNRQPSLHRLSIMAFRVKVLPWRTLRFNECACTPFNADFDGDEMNIHLPQTEEAKSEALNLMGVKENLITPKNAEPLIAAHQDFLTTFYLITQRDYFIDRSHFFQYISYFTDANERIDIPPPTILKPVELWTGKQLFTCLLRPNRFAKVLINVEIKERNYSDKGEVMCLQDGYVLIKRSELICGNLCKKSIGGGSKSGVIFALIRDNSNNIAAEVLSRIAKFSSRWIGTHGMSFGIKDVTPFEELVNEKRLLIAASQSHCQDQIDQFEKGIITLKAGCNAEQSLESVISGELNKIREKAGTILNEKLPRYNPALIMSICGSKGSNLNLCQMIGCVGQQVVSGSRIPNGFSTRTLPHFEHFSKYPAAKGFVENSFFTGLTATEFFFHTMGGREGLVDTAVKTADTGYMQRRLLKALEDLTIQYDNTVTNSDGDLLQFIYGDDSIDPMSMDDGNKIVCLKRLFQIIKQMYPNNRKEIYLSSVQLEEKVKLEIDICPLKKLINEVFFKELLDFFNIIIKKIKSKESMSSISEICYSHNEIANMTDKQVKEFFKLLWTKYHKAMIVPGEAVGAVAGQSIGEPGTQMTLKTFHFAGVASMNITLGVPRIKEIINASKNISTPIITAKLICETDTISARIVKGRVENTKLKDILEYIKEVMAPEGCYLILKIDLELIQNLHLEIKIEDVRTKIINVKPKKFDQKQVTITSANKIRINASDSKENIFFQLQDYKRKLGEIIICGFDTVSRAIINKHQKEDKYNLIIEGSGLKGIMSVSGIDHRYCISNDIMEVYDVLGIEAARSTIISQIKFTIGEHGIFVDNRHIQLLADLMTFKGVVLGFTRFGISKMKDSILMLASFEKTNDNLFDAAFHSRKDNIKGTSECIIMGKSIPLGTGLFKVFYDETSHNKLHKDKVRSFTKDEDICKRMYEMDDVNLLINSIKK